MVEVKSLSKLFVDHWALKETTWSVKDKRSLGLLGPNGAGKSTTMKIITGLLCSSEGQVLVDGFDIMKEPVEAKKKIGYLPETPPLYDELKVIDYLKFICGLKSVEKSQVTAQVDLAIDKMALQEMAFRPIRVLSKGFKQRVGIAQSLIGDPSILILDEPSVGLDPHQVYELREILKNLKRDHIIILSTHVLSEVQQVCDDVVILNKGEVKAQGTIEDLLQKGASSRIVEIRLKSFNSDVSAKIKALPNVEQTKYKNDTLELFLNPKAEANLDLYLSELASHNCGILSVQQKQQQLEDVFIEVTQ